MRRPGARTSGARVAIRDEEVARYARHARLFGTELVYETFAAEELRCLAEEHHRLREMLPRPVELTWLPPCEVSRILDERETIFAEYRRRYDAMHLEMTERLLRLRAELDELDREHTVGKITVVDREDGSKTTSGTSRRRRMNGEAVEMAQALRREGLVTSEIAEKLGVLVQARSAVAGERGERG